MTLSELKTKSKEILEMAQKSGVDSDIFFATTFDRYIKQIETMDKLQEIISKEGVMITKEYVKGCTNLCVNPALREYNNMVSSANKTVSTLLRITREFKDSKDNERDPLLDIINMKFQDE